ncbi:unnamed protein product, partial [Allacma fusca]
PMSSQRDEEMEENGEEKEDHPRRPHPLAFPETDTPSTYHPHLHANRQRPVVSQSPNDQYEYEQGDLLETENEENLFSEKSKVGMSGDDEEGVRQRIRFPVPSGVFTAPDDTEVPKGEYPTTRPIQLPKLSLNPPPIPEVNEILMKPKDEGK